MTLTSRKARSDGFLYLLLAFPAQLGEVAFMLWILMGAKTPTVVAPTS